MFHATFGYYAQGVVESTAVLPEGRVGRLLLFETPATNGVVAWCLEVHDLWISKAIAGRPRQLQCERNHPSRFRGLDYRIIRRRPDDGIPWRGGHLTAPWKRLI